MAIYIYFFTAEYFNRRFVTTDILDTVDRYDF